MSLIMVIIGLFAEVALIDLLGRRRQRREPTEGTVTLLILNTFFLVLELIGLLSGK